MYDMDGCVVVPKNDGKGYVYLDLQHAGTMRHDGDCVRQGVSRSVGSAGAVASRLNSTRFQEPLGFLLGGCHRKDPRPF